jgi:hypothetical protein
MKKTTYLLTIVAFAFASCSKKDGTTDLPHPVDNSANLQVPSSFGKKVLFEEFTGAWCGFCPRGTYYFDQVDSAYPGKAVGVSVHVGQGEVMQDPQLVTPTGGNLLEDFFQITGVPSGTVNRGPIDDPTDWPGVMGSQVGLFAKCGFSIDASSVSGNTCSITVHTGFSANLYGDYRLNVFLIETDIHSATDASYDQHNYYSQGSPNADPSLPYYYLPSVINDFHHMNVLRHMITSVPFGDQIPQSQMVKGHDYVKSFTVDLTSFNKANCSIIAFVDKYGTDPSQHQVQNVQKVKVGSSVGWN